MPSMTVRLMGLMESYPRVAERGVLEVDVEPSDTVADLLRRVGERVGQHMLNGLWNPDAGVFHHAVHVFLDGERVEDRQQSVGQAREAVFLLQVVGG